MASEKLFRVGAVLLLSLSTLLLIIATAIPGWYVGDFLVHADIFGAPLTFHTQARIGAFQSCIDTSQHLDLRDGSAFDDSSSTCAPVSASCQATFDGVDVHGTYPEQEPDGCAQLNVGRVALVVSVVAVGLASVCGALLLSVWPHSGLHDAVPLLAFVQLLLVGVSLVLLVGNIGEVEEDIPSAQSPYYSSWMGVSVYIAGGSLLLTALGLVLWAGARRWGTPKPSPVVLHQPLPPAQELALSPQAVFQHPQPSAYHPTQVQLQQPLITSLGSPY